MSELQPGAVFLKHDRVMRLVDQHAKVIRRWYMSAPPSQVRVFEQLNALAISAAYVIAGTGKDAAAVRQWFDMTLSQALADVLRQHGSGNA